MALNESRFIVSYPPHLVGKRSIQRLFAHRLIALVPVLIAAVYYFRLSGLKVMAIALVAAVAVEAMMQAAMKRPISVIDGSAAMSALVLACLLPATVPWWIVVIGAAVAMILGKHLFGGLGNNPFNDALVGWVFLRLSWPEHLSHWMPPSSGWIPDPPLFVAKFKGIEAMTEYDFQFLDLFLGNQAGGVGTTCGLAALIGGAYLMIARAIDWRIPLSFLATVGVITTGLHMANPEEFIHPLFHLLAGSVMFGAFFVATDPTTTPSLRWANVWFGMLAGFLVVAIRLWGIHIDGVVFAVLLANAAAPLLDKIRHRPFGWRTRL